MDNKEQVSYELKKDVTGKVTPNRNRRTINVYGQEMRVPYPPKSNCKKCWGRGFIGIIKDKEQDKVLMCDKCYRKQQ